MATTINADTAIGGAVVTGDASGVLALQAAGNTGLTLNSSRAIGVGSTPSFGTAGQVLTSAGSGAAPTWASGGGSAATPTVEGTVYGKMVSSSTGTTALGYNALVNNTGARNTAVGWNAAPATGAGADLTAIGKEALASNTSGNYNVAVGGNDAGTFSALVSNTTGSFLVAVGNGALGNNTTGFENVAVGYQALFSNVTGQDNTAIGHLALKSNTNSYNTAIGFNTLYTNTSGQGNTACGQAALTSNTSGFTNTAMGGNALYSNTTGTSNTALGYLAGFGSGVSNTTGDNNTFIGNAAVGASSTASNVITLGNSAIATLRCQQTSITSLSDRRDKSDIVDIPAGMNFIQQLRPVSFKWNMRDGAKVGIPEFGFIAQELQDAQVASGVIVPNLVSTENPDKLEASQGTLIPILVKAIQELKAEFDAYKLTHP